MSKFVEVLVTGLTVASQVRMAGEFVQVPDSFEIQGKRKQVQRWGHPKYHEVTRREFLDQGGTELEIDEATAPFTKTPEAPETPQDDAGGDAGVPVTPFMAFDGLNVEDTLSLAAGLDEDALTAFISHEKNGENRSGVLGPLGAGSE